MSSWFADILRDQPTHVPFKVLLFTKIHEMKGSLRIMAQIQSWPVTRRRKWIKEHGSTLREVGTLLSNHAMPEFEDFDANMSFLDGDTLKLMGEYAYHLREFVHLSRSLLESADLRTSSTGHKRERSNRSKPDQVS